MGLFSAGNRHDTLVAWMYVLVQLGLLVAIFVLPSGDAWPLPHWLFVAAKALQWLGALVLAVSLVNLGISLTPLPTPVPHGVLKTGGLYRLVRHPIYSGIDALAIGAAVIARSWLVLLAATALVGWFAAKARWEERHLRARYPDYEAYAARTPRFVPRLAPRHRGGVGR